MHENEFLAHELMVWTRYMNEEGKSSYAIKSAYPYLYRRYEYLASTEIKCSNKAQATIDSQFVEKVDLRTLNWTSKLTLKTSGKKVHIRKYIVWEHYTTAYEFKTALNNMYINQSLSVDSILALMAQQKMAWITKEENQRLNALGYRHQRLDPEEAYRKACISFIET